MNSVGDFFVFIFVVFMVALMCVAKGCEDGHLEACESYCATVKQEVLKSHRNECWCTNGTEGTKAWGKE